MRLSEMKKTGKDIFEDIKRLYAERNELGEACGLLADKLGYESPATKLLEETFKSAEQRLGIALEKEYYGVAVKSPEEDWEDRMPVQEGEFRMNKTPGLVPTGPDRSRL